MGTYVKCLSPTQAVCTHSYCIEHSVPATETELARAVQREVALATDAATMALARAIYEARKFTGPSMAMGIKWAELSEERRAVYLRWADEIMNEDGETVRRLWGSRENSSEEGLTSKDWS